MDFSYVNAVLKRGPDRDLDNGVQNCPFLARTGQSTGEDKAGRGGMCKEVSRCEKT